MHEPGVPRRYGEAQPGGNQGPAAAGVDGGINPGIQVGARVPGPGVRRKREIGIKLYHRHLEHGSKVATRLDWTEFAIFTRVLAWMDLEMTGLDPDRHVIVEIATVITDDDLAVVAEGPDLVLHARPDQLAAMDEVVRTMHTKSGLLPAIEASTTDLEQAGLATLDFLKQHLPSAGSTPLCGNSIGTDRRFLTKWLPEVDRYLHYRSVDVSTVKELARRWYPQAAAEQPKKVGSHRALDDILESIEELRYYRRTIFRPVSESGEN